MTNLDQRICIVGGGPAGITAAYYLDKKGYKDVTVLERLDRVGGKCNSPYYKGKTYEMGAVMAVPSYYTVLEMCKEVGIEGDGPVFKRKFVDSRTGKEIEGIAKEEGLQVMEQMKKMAGLLATKYKGYDSNGHRGTHPDLMETFDDFCDMNGVPLVKKIWVNPYTAFGYGYFNLVPAAYVLKYLDWPTLNSFINMDLITWTAGTNSVWQGIACALNRYPRLCTKISKVERKDGKVYVYSNYGKEEYDKIIFTSPLQDLYSYVNLNEEEEKYFSKIKCEDYKIFACTVKNYPEISAYLQGNMVQSRAGHVMVLYPRWDKEEDQIITLYILGNPQEKVGVEEARKAAEEDMKLMGYDIKDIIMEKDWRYFPHINCDEYKNGWYDTVESWQGENSTYYAGEVMSFSDMEETATYSKELIERFF